MAFVVFSFNFGGFFIMSFFVGDVASAAFALRFAQLLLAFAFCFAFRTAAIFLSFFFLS